jgi:hypothetical protein
MNMVKIQQVPKNAFSIIELSPNSVRKNLIAKIKNTISVLVTNRASWCLSSKCAESAVKPVIQSQQSFYSQDFLEVKLYQLN